MSLLEAHSIILDPNATAAERLAALDDVPAEGGGVYLLRSVLLLDRDALLRARAAERTSVVEWLLEGMNDPAPRVREASLASLARVRARAGAAAIRRAALEDPIWWVRRAAVHALASILERGAVETLVGVLDDPFWRVRHAAVEALRALASDDLQLQAELTALRGQTDSARAALERLRRVFGGEVGPVLEPPAPRADGVLFNEDPAVMTARLEDRSFDPPLAELIELLPTSHAALRKLLVARLAEVSPRALRAAMAWLEDPRIPHATGAVLDALQRAGSRGLAVAKEIAGDPSAGERARGWAVAWIGAAGVTEMIEAVRGALRDRSPLVRALACESLAKLGFAPDVALLDDADERVALAALGAFREVEPATLSARPFAGSIAARRVLFDAADRVGDRARFFEASADPDPYLRASALGVLARAGALDAEARARAFRDPDPWIRIAVLDDALLDSALVDLDLEVRRAAFDRLRPGPRARAAAVAALDAPDAALRVRATELLSPAEDLEALLRLTMDRDPAVRSAASARVERSDVSRVLEQATDPTVRKAAFTRLFAAALEARAEPEWLAPALVREDPEVRAHLEAMRIPFGAALSPPKAKPRREESVAQVEKRALGRTGLEVAPLAISGAFDLSPSSLLHAFERGVNLFFWEPRYAAMTRFLRVDPQRRDRLHIAAGSFHGSASAVRQDVERSLKRLRTDRIDLFLLFWVRSRERLSDELYDALSRVKAAGKIRAFGFSTHDRKLACDAIEARPWDAVMVRHNAAHPGAEASLFPAALRTNTGVLAFSALCYGRLLLGERAPSPEECYRYCLSQRGVAAVISAPRRHRELIENLSLLSLPALSEERLEALRAHGRTVHAESRDWAELIRRVPDALLHAPEAPSIDDDSELRR